MEWWIQQTNVYRASIHALQYTIEILLLIWEQLLKSSYTLFCCISKNHLAHGLNLYILKEHVLGAAKSDSNCAKTTSHFCIVWSIGISTNNEFRILLAQLHQIGKFACYLRRPCLNFSIINLAS